jgi:hypothetical protein
MQMPPVPQAQMPQAAVPQGMPQAMPHTGMSQTTMASMTQPAMMCEAPQIEGHTWAPWQNWNSWTESADGTWQYNAMPCGCGAPNGAPPEPQPAPQQMWPQDATWPQQGETQQWQEQQEQQQPTQTWQREPGHEILKQLGVGGPRPTGTQWNSLYSFDSWCNLLSAIFTVQYLRSHLLAHQSPQYTKKIFSSQRQSVFRGQCRLSLYTCLMQ